VAWFGIAEQLARFGAQLGDAGHHGGVVELVAAAAAGERGLGQLLAQGAVGQLRVRRLADGVEQRDHVLALELARLGGLGGAGDLRIRHAGELFLGVDHDRRIVHFLQHVLAELGLQLGQLGVHRLQLVLVGFAQLAPERTKSVW
jgi:hypothetical protein